MLAASPVPCLKACKTRTTPSPDLYRSLMLSRWKVANCVVFVSRFCRCRNATSLASWVFQSTRLRAGSVTRLLSSTRRCFDSP